MESFFWGSGGEIGGNTSIVAFVVAAKEDVYTGLEQFKYWNEMESDVIE